MAIRFKEGNVWNKDDKAEELLVFGYSCKLFRDDEKALFIDQGKHLIPWMGDDTLKIDRYDARGTLYDLKHAESPIGGYDRLFGLTDTERHVEMLCEQERYRSLLTNEEEESMYREEELKRLHSAINDKTNSYGQVEYKYDGVGQATPGETTEKEKNEGKAEETEDDEPFVPSPQLDIPLNMVLPETVKHNAIIEKTAMFITSQGPQMEILLKMKQAGNPQFNFLSFDNPLHGYYRHLLMAIKAGRYTLAEAQRKAVKEMENDEDNDEDNDHYLHPSLASSISRLEAAPSIPSINYKPSADCAYTMLVSKIKDKKEAALAAQPSPSLSRLKQALHRFKDGNGDLGADSDSNSSSISNDSSAQSSRLSAEETPPSEMQTIIDKMASYVAKNGRDFETIVKSKGDTRFEFLHLGHKYNKYYQVKLRQFEIVEGKAVPHTEEQSDKLKLVTPVSFSIKKPRDAESVIEKSALPVEESSEEEATGEVVNEDEGATIPEEEKIKEEPAPVAEVPETAQQEVEKELEVQPVADKKEEVEMVDLAAIEDKEERTRKILATERLKDKLTAAVRGKVALASKEKQLQLDRKRRAAAFLKSLQAQSGTSAVPLHGPLMPGNPKVERTDNGDSDVESLPDGDKKEDENKKEPERKRHKHKEDRKDKTVKKSEKNSAKSNSNSRVYDIQSSSDSDTSNSSESGESPRKRRRHEDHSRRRDDRRHRKKKKRKDDRSPRKHSKSRKHKRSREEESRTRRKRHRKRSGSSEPDP